MDSGKQTMAASDELVATQSPGVSPCALDKRLDEYLSFVRDHSTFYAKFWSTTSTTSTTSTSGLTALEAYPLTDHAAYWQANTCLNSKVVTSKQHDGIIFKTGGTTAKPKVSFYSHQEFEVITETLAECLVRCGVRHGDVVANLFYAGDMYGSFLLHVLSVFGLSLYKKLGAIQLPVAGHVPIASMASHILEFEGSVVLSTVTNMVKIAEYLGGDSRTAPTVRLLLFSGEALYRDQVSVLHRAFPNAEIRSLVYGSMDAGIIGLPLSEPSADPRVHQVNRPGLVLEVVTEDGVSTKQPGVKGSLVVTNLDRALMPVVRYPSGDMGEWVDYEKGLFRVLGRDQTAIRLGPVSIDFMHLRDAVTAALESRPVAGCQAIVDREEGKDTLTARLAFQPTDEEEQRHLATRVAEELDKARPMFQGHVELGLINPLRVEFVALEKLTMNDRSGKAIHVIDNRDVTI